MAMPGYNPNMSLLPSGGGTIQPMSGGGLQPVPGGYNPSSSLIPPSGGQINPFSGGFFNEPIHIIGGTTAASGAATGTSTGTSTGAVETSKGPIVANYKPLNVKADKITSTSFQVSWSNKLPDVAYNATATPTTSAPTPSPATTSDATTPAPTPVAPVAPITKPINGVLDANKSFFTFEGLTPSTKYDVVINAQKTGVAKALSSDPILVETKTKNSANNTDKNILIPTKDVTLFGETLTLDNPKLLKGEEFTESQKTALQKFGLDGPGLTFTKKQAVVQALFDGQCNTDLPLIFKRNCDPIREIVQSLALNLLSKMKPTPNSNIEGLKSEEVPEVTYTPDSDGNITISLKFKPGSLSILSRFGLKPTSPKPNAPKPNAPKLEKPTGLKTGTITPTSIQVSWDNRVKGIKYSALATIKQQKVKGIIAARVGNNMQTENTFTFPNLSPNTKYAVTITATLDKKSEVSEVLIITTPPLPVDSIKPLNPVAKDITATEFTITWDNKDLVAYTAEATDDKGNKKQGTITGNSAKFSDLIANTKYTVIITATKDDKTEKTDDIEVTTTPVNAPVSITPQGLSKTSETADAFTVSWTNPIVGAAYTATAKGPSGDSHIGKISDNNSSVTFSGLSTKGDYEVTVESKKDGKSESSPIKVSFGTPDPDTKLEKPTGIKVNYKKDVNKLFISFDNQNDKDIDYDISATLNGSKIDVEKKVILKITTTYTINNPQAGKYVITVTARKGSDEQVSDPFEYEYIPDEIPGDKLEKPTGINIEYLPKPEGPLAVDSLRITFDKIPEINYNVSATLNGNPVEVANYKQPESNYDIKSPQKGKYIVIVTATKGAESIESDPVEYDYDPSAPPQGPDASPQGPNIPNTVNSTVGGYDVVTTTGFINNPARYCYAISILQMLYSIPEVRDAILAYKCEKEITVDEVAKLVTPLPGESDIIREKINTIQANSTITEAIDVKQFFCILKNIMTLLNTNTITFEKLQSTANGTSITKGDAIPAAYSQYFTKVWGEYYNKKKSFVRENKRGPAFNFNQQQDASDFFQEIIMPIFYLTPEFNFIDTMFKSRFDTQYKCENKKDKNGKELTWTRIGSELSTMIDLYPELYIDNKKSEDGTLSANWQKNIEGTKYIELDKLVEFQQTPESIYNKKCDGPVDKINTAKKSIISITESNKYLLFKINRQKQTGIRQKPNGSVSVEQQIDTNLNILANPKIIVSGKKYNLFGSVLYSAGGGTPVLNKKGTPTGKIKITDTTSRGHYLYDRFYIKDDDETVESTSLPNSLPFVLYNDENVSYKNSSGHSIDKKSFIIVYRLVPGQKDFAPEIPKMPNEQCKKVVYQWLDRLENGKIRPDGTKVEITEITEKDKQDLIAKNPDLTLDTINQCITYYKTMEGITDELKPESGLNSEEEEEEEEENGSNSEEEEENGSNSEEEEENGLNSEEEEEEEKNSGGPPISVAAAKAAREAANKASREAANKASREAANKASREAANKAAREAANKATANKAAKPPISEICDEIISLLNEEEHTSKKITYKRFMYLVSVVGEKYVQIAGWHHKIPADDKTTQELRECLESEGYTIEKQTANNIKNAENKAKQQASSDSIRASVPLIPSKERQSLGFTKPPIEQSQQWAKKYAKNSPTKTTTLSFANERTNKSGKPYRLAYEKNIPVRPTRRKSGIKPTLNEEAISNEELATMSGLNAAKKKATTNAATQKPQEGGKRVTQHNKKIKTIKQKLAKKTAKRKTFKKAALKQKRRTMKKHHK